MMGDSFVVIPTIMKMTSGSILPAIPVTPFAIYPQSSNVIEPGMNVITYFKCEEYIVEF